MTLTRDRATDRGLKRLRECKRSYMRRWRSVPTNRQRERAAQQRWKLVRKERVLSLPGPKLCGFCYSRAPIAEVERLVATRTGFRRIFVPYCGQC
jgi:hypothetical protein